MRAAGEKHWRAWQRRPNLNLHFALSGLTRTLFQPHHHNRNAMSKGFKTSVPSSTDVLVPETLLVSSPVEQARVRALTHSFTPPPEKEKGRCKEPRGEVCQDCRGTKGEHW